MLKRRKIERGQRLVDYEAKFLKCSNGCGRVIGVPGYVTSVLCWRCTAFSVGSPLKEDQCESAT